MVEDFRPSHDENESVSILMLPLPLDMHQPCVPVIHKTQDMSSCDEHIFSLYYSTPIIHVHIA